MDISPNFSANDWKQLNLEGAGLLEKDWQTAIDVLKNRLHERYIKPVDVLIESESDKAAKDKRFGFTTLAIDFLLMETFQAFKDGDIDSKGKSKSLFKKYLETSPRFCHYFITDRERICFYEDFRCGVLHQAEVQSSALVWSVGDLYERNSGKETVNRLAIHRALKADVDEYIASLRSPKSIVLRKAFKVKMDAIANRA